MIAPLEGLLVIDFSQFLSGPSASLRLADLGARVIKVERPDGGDLCRELYHSNLSLEGDSTLFHSVNRHKESFAADLKDASDAACVHELVRHADVVIQNFRPGVMERLGFDYEAVRQYNPRVVYGEITGYGNAGPWRDKPGQDLLVQSLSGLPWLNGDADQPPIPIGLAVVDLFTGAHLVQGILACLVRRGTTGYGGRVELSLIESSLDLQFEVLTTHLNDGGRWPVRGGGSSGHPYLAAPYGIYATTDGYLALSVGSVTRLGELLDCPALLEYSDSKLLFECRDEIKQIVAERLRGERTGHWLAWLEAGGVWCADVYTWPKLLGHEAFQALDIVQEVGRGADTRFRTTRCPIRVDGETFKSDQPAPRIGEHTRQIKDEFDLP